MAGNEVNFVPGSHILYKGTPEIRIKGKTPLYARRAWTSTFQK